MFTSVSNWYFCWKRVEHRVTGQGAYKRNVGNWSYQHKFQYSVWKCTDEIRVWTVVMIFFFTRHKILRLISYWGKAVSWANFLPSVAWAFIHSELPCSKSSKRSSWNNLRKPLHGAWKRKGLNKKPFHIYTYISIMHYIIYNVLLCYVYTVYLYAIMNILYMMYV